MAVLPVVSVGKRFNPIILVYIPITIIGIFCHEFQRYASYFIHYYWADKHGIDFIGKLWRESKSPEDPIQTYMRLNGLTVDQMNAELYDAATKFVT